MRKDTNLLFKKLKESPKKGEPKEKLDFDSRQLKKIYFELFKSKKNEVEPPQEILDGIKSYEDKIYERELRKEVGPIFDKIKMEAMEEVGYKPADKKKAKEMEEIMEGKSLLEKYGIKTIEELEELKKSIIKGEA